MPQAAVLENFTDEVEEFNNEDLRKSVISNVSSKSKREPKTVQLILTPNQSSLDNNSKKQSPTRLQPVL